MTVQFGFPVLIAGALAIAALLFAFQRLRVRHRVVRLPAAMLWRAALETAPPGALGGRFRRWPAYLLALAIALALWTAGARPELTAASGARFTLFYLDASAAMTADGAFAEARRRLIADVRATPADRRAVVLGDGGGTMLLAPAENIALLARRLSGIDAAARPPGFADWLARAGGTLTPGATIRYYGPPGGVVGAPAGLRVVRAYAPAPVPGNRGIVTLGIAPAASGAWGRADVRVEAVAADGSGIAADDVRFTRDGAAFTPGDRVATGAGQWLLRGVVADGAVLKVALRRGDRFAADDEAAIRLPDRRPLRVALTAGVPDSLRRAVRLDPALVVSDPARAQVIVRTANEAAGTALPALVLTKPDAQAATFVIAQPGGDGAAIADSLDRLGLADLDAAALADQLGRPIAVTGAADGRRGIAVWDALFADDAGFARSRTLPLFVSNALRWLGRTDPWVPYAKAGEPLPDLPQSDDLADDLAGDPTLAAFGDAAMLPAAGMHRIGDRLLAVALTDRATTLARAQSTAATAVADADGGLPVDLPLIVLLLFAGGLLAVEWVLFQRGAIP